VEEYLHTKLFILPAIANKECLMESANSVINSLLIMNYSKIEIIIIAIIMTITIINITVN